jgi:hypothetical protein
VATAEVEHLAQLGFVGWSPARGLALLDVDRDELDRSLRLLAGARGTPALDSSALLDLGPLREGRARPDAGSDADRQEED